LTTTTAAQKGSQDGDEIGTKKKLKKGQICRFFNIDILIFFIIKSKKKIWKLFFKKKTMSGRDL